MNTHVGDRIIIHGTHLDDARRVGIVTAVANSDGGPTTLIFPGTEAVIEPAEATIRPARHGSAGSGTTEAGGLESTGLDPEDHSPPVMAIDRPLGCAAVNGTVISRTPLR